MIIISLIIQPRLRGFTNLILLSAHDHSTKIYGLLSYSISLCMTTWPFLCLFFFFLFVHDHSTKTLDPHWLTSFVCTRLFNKNTRSSFIYSLFYAQPFYQKLDLSLIYLFYLPKTIRQKYMVFFHIVFL